MERVASKVRQLDRQEGRLQSMSRPFRITVLSMGSGKEFGATNKNNSFKNRLPTPITLRGEWKVGMDAVSLPNSTLFTREINPPYTDGVKAHLFMTGHIGYRRGGSLSYVASIMKFTNADLEKITSTVDGVGFMKSVTNWLEQERLRDHTGDDAKWSQDDGGETKRTFVTFKWEGEELLVDNTDTWNKYDSGGGIKQPSLFINIELALKMGWLERDANDTYRLGPNLRQELFDPTVMQDIQQSDVRDVSESDASHVNGNTWFFWTVNDYWNGLNGVSQQYTPEHKPFLRLSINCNWRFINLNSAFEGATNSGRRSLICYSNMAEPAVVGGQRVDILREFDYGVNGTGSTYFEPQRVQYMPLRSNELDIIEVEIGEKSGKLAQLSEGTTSVTLSFIPA